MTATIPNGHYVYLHLRTSNLSVFYVGKGKGKRAWDKYSGSQWWKRVAAKHGWTVEILKDGLDESEALSLEMSVIAAMRRVTSLVNLVDGGGGTSGWKHSPEAKARISAFNKGKKLSAKALGALIKHNKGRKCTPEQKLKMSLAKKGKPGHPMSEGTRKKISASHVGIKPSEESRKKMSESKKGKCVGRLSPTYDHTIRIFRHAKHGAYEGTRGDFILKYDIRAGDISAVINGDQKSVKGWKLS